MSQAYINAGPIYTSQSKYNTMKEAGTLEIGREYRITDYEPQDKLTAGTGISISSDDVISLNSDAAIAIYNTRIDDANNWLTNGYTKTRNVSEEYPTATANLPAVCTDSDRWGVLLYVAENNENKAGLQQYFPIDGTYKGRIFYRSVTGWGAGIDPEFGEWNIVPWSSEKQDTLVSGTNIKTINNESILSSGNLDLVKSETLNNYSTTTQMNAAIEDHHDDSKQDAVSDLETIRTGASLGATAVQPATLSNYSTTTEMNSAISNYHDSTKADVSAIPTKTSQLTNDSGFLTEHQSLAEYRTSSAQDVIDATKQDVLVSGTNIKTINNESILGSGNITVTGGVLAQALTTDITVGHLESGTAFAAGTSIESILRQMLIGTTPPTTDSDVYVGHISDISKSVFRTLSVEELVANSTAKSVSDSPFIWNPTTAKDIVFLMFKDGVVPTGGSLTSSGVEMPFTGANVLGTSGTDDDWNLSGSNGHEDVTIGESNYTVCGMYFSTWQTTDQIKVNYAQEE